MLSRIFEVPLRKTAITQSFIDVRTIKSDFYSKSFSLLITVFEIILLICTSFKSRLLNSEQNVSVYPKEIEHLKPNQGEGLNQKADVSLIATFPNERGTKEPIKVVAKH